MYDAVELAKYIITKCVDDSHPISNLQLQKILYYIQKDFLHRDRIAFLDPIEAWQFGPVVPNVYYTFYGSGSMKIVSRYLHEGINYDDLLIINKIVEAKRDLYPWDMVNDTHKPGGAWYQTFQNGQGNHALIPLELIKAEQ